MVTGAAPTMGGRIQHQANLNEVVYAVRSWIGNNQRQSNGARMKKRNKSPRACSTMGAVEDLTTPFIVLVL